MAIHLTLGDITTFEADAIVNAANAQLLPGGGVSGAIHSAAGPGLAEACARWVAEHGIVPTGDAAITPGFLLPARWVIHAVGPIWRGGDEGEPDLLCAAYRACIDLADSAGCRTVAFPSISTGIFGYPPQLAAPVALGTLRGALASAEHVDRATLVLHDETTLQAYEAAASDLDIR